MDNEKLLEDTIQEIEGKVEQEAAWQPITLKELMTKEFKDAEWIIEQLIPAESINVISGAPAAHKTWLVLELALKVASGDILFDKFTTMKTGVLIIDEENGERLLQKRLQKLGSTDNLPIYFLSLKGYKISKMSVEHIVKFAQEYDIKLVIFDSLVRIHSEDENDATRMAKVFGLLKGFVKEGLAVIFTHHNRKLGIFRANPSQDMRGSSDILASVDCHLALERKHQEDYLVITQTKLRQGEEIRPFKLSIINEENRLRFEYAGEVDEVQTKKASLQTIIKDILAQEERPMYKQELFAAIKKLGAQGGQSTFKTAVEEMVSTGELFERRGEKNKVFCSLKPFPEDFNSSSTIVISDG